MLYNHSTTIDMYNKTHRSSFDTETLAQLNGLHLIMHQTIGLTGYIRPLTLTLVH